MWAVFVGFIKSNFLRLLPYIGIFVAVAGVLFGVKRAGRQAEKIDQMKTQIKATKEANEIRSEVSFDHARGVVPKRVRKFYIR